MYLEPQRARDVGEKGCQTTVLRIRFPLRQYLLRHGDVAKVRRTAPR